MRNQLLNIVWTIIGFLPVCLFWFNVEIGLSFLISLICSFVAACLPERIYIQLHISKDYKKFEALGVRFLKRFSQHGDFKKNGAKGIKSYLGTLAMFERFHYICLVFFLASCIYAFLDQQIVLGLMIFLANAIYNVFPILLQQYNRLRMMKVLNQLSSKAKET
jgi:hypothetical protein